MTVDGKREKTTALSRNSLGSFLLGKSSWIVKKDNPGLFHIKRSEFFFFLYILDLILDFFLISLFNFKMHIKNF